VSQWLEIPEQEAIAAATASPARSMQMGDRRGIITAGADADLVFLDPQLHVLRTMVGGRTVYRAPEPATKKH
jgi:N-acetylglucosamine-6-phosphate deacetylase